MPLQVALAAPVNVMATCEVFPFWLKSITLLLMRLPPMERLWELITPAGLAWKVPLNATVTLAPTVSDRATAGSYCNTPETPWPTVRLLATAAVSMVTVWPLSMTTSSAAVGRSEEHTSELQSRFG